MESSSLEGSSPAGRCQTKKKSPQIQLRGREHPGSVVMELSRDVGDVSSPSSSRRDPLPRSMPQFPPSVSKIAGGGSS